MIDAMFQLFGIVETLSKLAACGQQISGSMIVATFGFGQTSTDPVSVSLQPTFVVTIKVSVY